MDSNGEILIIEDDSDDSDLIRDLISELLSLNNYRNTVAVISDSADAIPYLKKRASVISHSVRY
jgi:hypothetical protein